MRTIAMKLALTSLSALVFGCGQDDVVFPDAGTCDNGDCECDASSDDGGVPSYPPGPYGIEQGKTFPKLTWNARVNGVNAVFSSEDAYEQKQGKKAMVIVVSARNCPACEELATAIGGKEDEFDAAAVMVGMCFADMLDTNTELSLDEAQSVMVDTDHWPGEWFVTNEHTQMPSDAEEGFPSVTWVRLSDMKVMEVTSRDYIAEKGAEQLLAEISQ